MSRKKKQQILESLAQPDLEVVFATLQGVGAKERINVLFSGICRNEPLVRWHAISAIGPAVAELAGQDMEEARIVMRRLLWSLNEESGGIGWGAPEAMAEILCAHEGLAREYLHMFLSYMREDGEELFQEGNFLEHEPLQQGLLWGAGRLAECRGDLMRQQGMGRDLVLYLASADAGVRGLAARALGLLGGDVIPDALRSLTDDAASFSLYEKGQVRTVTVGALAAEALGRMEG